MERGYLDSREMANMFNLLRSNDLIWANVVNNYLLGNKPPAFDLLYWNSDGTRMARGAQLVPAQHLRREQPDQARARRARGRADRPRPDQAGHLRRGRGEGPHRALVRGLADHAAGRRQGALRDGVQRPHRRGHQPPGPRKGAYWVNEQPAATPEAWLEAAERHEGSWWTDWIGWLGQRSGGMVDPPSLGSGKHPRWRTRRAPTSWRSRRSSLRSCAVAQEGEVDNRGFRPGLGCGRRHTHRGLSPEPPAPWSSWGAGATAGLVTPVVAVGTRVVGHVARGRAPPTCRTATPPHDRGPSQGSGGARPRRGQRNHSGEIMCLWILS